MPYELPFIAITEKAFTRLVNEQYEVLQRGIAIHKRLERLVLEESGLDEVVRALAAATGGAVCVLSGRGETISSKAFRRQVPDDAMEQVRAEVVRRSELAAGSARGQRRVRARPPGHRRPLARPPRVAARARCASGVARGSPRHRRLGDFERLILQQAVTVVALELMRQRAMRDTERRLAGDVLAEALTGRLSDEELAMRLRPFGIGQSAAVLVFAGAMARRAPAEGDLDRFLADANVGALVATRERLLCAVVDADDNVDPVALAGRARDALAEDGASLRAAASRAAPVARSAAPSTRRAARSRRPRSRTALPAGRLLSGPGRVPAAPVAPGRRRAAPLLRQRARPAGGRERRVR